MISLISLLTRRIQPRHIVILVVGLTVLAVACRGGGANPSEEDQVIPVLVPTVPASVCQQDRQPADAPQFADIDSSLYTESESGLMYYDLITGDGPAPTIFDLVEVNYAAWHVDGCMFDSSYVRGEPSGFLLVGIISGWREALLGMNAGGTRVLEIPSVLAYGTAGSPPVIPPDANLTFYVTLVSVTTPAQAEATVEVLRATQTAEAEAGDGTATSGN